MAEVPQLKAVTIKRGKNTPTAMWRGAAAASDGKCYFMSEDKHSLWMYDVEKDDWFPLHQCPYKNTGLTVINGLLTSVGGQKGEPHTAEYEFTNHLYSLSNRRWTEKFPPMKHDPALGVNLKKGKAAVVQSGSSVLVIAGRGDGGFEQRIDVLDTKSSEWSEAPELPTGSQVPSAAVCGDELYVIDGYNKWVYQCFLDELIGDTKPISSVWSKKADTPYEYAACASLCGQLVAIGGVRTGGGETPTINAYDANHDSWYEIGKLASGRSHLLVAQLSENKVVVAGGKGHDGGLLTEIITGVL